MRIFQRFLKPAGSPTKSTPRISIRHFAATAQNHKYQTPKFKQPQDPVMSTTTMKGQPFDRQVLDSMLRRRMFYTPSFEIYGGTAGLYDYGPVRLIYLVMGCFQTRLARIIFTFPMMKFCDSHGSCVSTSVEFSFCNGHLFYDTC